MDENRVKELISEEIAKLFGRDHFTVSTLIQLLDGRNIQVGRATGTKIGTGVDQKLGFYGATPIVRPVAPTNTATIISTLQSLGLTQ